mmetsp:Transcript_117195/g.327994  ORF Transcript_117195/g.327994 Transcript_117195/m.327994 type:complete len:212 (-) Transcript_117195:52-687(-)
MSRRLSAATTTPVRSHAGSTVSGSPISQRVNGGIHSPVLGKNQALSVTASIGFHSRSCTETFPSMTPSITVRAQERSASSTPQDCTACSAIAMRIFGFLIVLSSKPGLRRSHATSSPQPPAVAAMSGVSPALPFCTSQLSSNELLLNTRHTMNMSHEWAARTNRSAPTVVWLGTRVAPTVMANVMGTSTARGNALPAIAGHALDTSQARQR